MAGLSLSQLFRRYTDEGDVRALGEVFDRAAPELLTVARHLAGDEAAAEDLVQATFLAAIEHPERFDPSRDLVPWLLGILANKARAARTSEARVPDPARLPGERVEDPETDAQLREFMGTLEKALERVPEAYRSVLRIHLAEGKGAEEIARELERNSDTVRVQLHRGLRHLRRRLPAGFALGGLVLVSAPRGMQVVRAMVLERAAALTGATAVGGTAAGIAGGVLMGKKLAVAAVVICLASGSWWLLRERAEPRSAEPVAQADPTLIEADPSQESAGASRLTTATPSVGDSNRSSASSATDRLGALDMTWTWSDGKPAAGLGVAAGYLQVESPSRFGTTNEAGLLTFENLPEGELVIQTDRGCSSSRWLKCSVAAGVRTAAAFTVPSGFTIQGRVLDPEGGPVAGARLWTANTEDTDGTPLGTSEANGSYVLRDLDAACGLFATADRFGASKLVQLREHPADASGVVRLDLALRGAGGRIRGMVRDPEGNPVEDAWVGIRCKQTVTVKDVESWPCPWTATDAEGAFALEGLHVGQAEVFVDRRTIFARWNGLVEIEEGRTATVDVRLEAGFTLEGTVTLPDGTASGAASVRLEPSDSSKKFDGRRTRWARADAEGRFRMVHVPSGSVEVVAEAKDHAGHASGSLKGRSGELLRWDAVLKVGLVIRGRLVDEAGLPVEGWTVETGTRAVLDAYPSDARTGADGRFELLGCADVPFLVAAYPPPEPGRRYQGIPGATATGVRPGEAERILTVTSHSRPTAYVTGRIVDAQGQPVQRATIRTDSWATHFGTAAMVEGDGAFRLGPLPAQAWPVTVHLEGRPAFVLGTFSLEPDEVRDLGTIALKPLGRFELMIRREDGALVERPWIALCGPEYSHFLESADGSTFRSDDLYAGTYTLVPIGANVATHTRTVEIRGGETTKLDLRLPAGVVQSVTFGLPEGETPPQRLRVVARSADGAVVVDAGSTFNIFPDGTWVPSFRAGFAPGCYTLEATSVEGWYASLDLQFADTSTQPQDIETRLVRRP